MTRLVDEGLLDEQIEARSAEVRDLVQHPGWHYIVEELQAYREMLQSEILGGKLDDVSYRRYSGTLEGVMFALNLPIKLIRSVQEDPDA